MPEYIKREAVIKHLRECEGTPPEIGYIYPIFKAIECFVEELPAADAVEVVRGRWVNNGIEDSILSACSVCGFPCGACTFNYCPNCGAKMKVM